jgi:hypothetical protein
MTPSDVAAAADLRLDVARLRELQRRADAGQELTPLERLALADWLGEGRAR